MRFQGPRAPYALGVFLFFCLLKTFFCCFFACRFFPRAPPPVCYRPRTSYKPALTWMHGWAPLPRARSPHPGSATVDGIGLYAYIQTLSGRLQTVSGWFRTPPDVSRDGSGRQLARPFTSASLLQRNFHLGPNF